MISMHDIAIVIKSFFLIFIVWFTDTIIYQVVSLTFISPSVREFFIETKEIISWSVSALILVLTILRIRNERRKK